jgi:RHS repeat-associated protein
LVSWKDQAGVSVSYGYDDAGNRTGNGSGTDTFDQRNQLLTSNGTAETLTWTARGTLAKDTVGKQTSTYSYDALGRLATFAGSAGSAGSTSYTYDSLDRVASRGGVAFTYAGLGLDPVSDGSTSIARDPADGPIALRKGNGPASLVGRNQHGDTTSLYAADGKVSDSSFYTPFGVVAGASGSTGAPIGFQSDYTDPASKQVWMGARWYSPTHDTFTSRDSFPGQLSSPISLNRYTYASGNPLGRFDADGHCGTDTVKSGKKAFGQLFSGDLGGAIDTASDAAKDCIDGAKKTVDDATGAVEKATTSVENQIVKPLLKTAARVVHHVYDIATNVESRIASLPSSVSRAVSDGYDNFRRGAVVVNQFMTDHKAAIVTGLKLVATVATGLAVTALCMGGTLGAATPGCIAAGFAAGKMVNAALSCQGQSGGDCSKSVAIAGASGYAAGLTMAAFGGFNLLAGGSSAGVDTAVSEFLSTGHVNFGHVATSAATGAATGGLLEAGGSLLGMAFGSGAASETTAAEVAAKAEQGGLADNQWMSDAGEGREAPGSSTISSGASDIAKEAAGGGPKPFVMGIKDHLDDFAQQHGGSTWKSLPESQLPGDAWKSGVTRMLSDPDQRVLFNLDGVDVWQGVTRAASGKGGATDWELLQIKYGGFPNLEFWLGGVRVGNPFG